MLEHFWILENGHGVRTVETIGDPDAGSQLGFSDSQNTSNFIISLVNFKPTVLHDQEELCAQISGGLVSRSRFFGTPPTLPSLPLLNFDLRLRGF